MGGEKKERKTQLSQHHQKFHHRRISESDLTTIWFEGVSKPPLSLSLLLPLASVSANYARSNLRTVCVHACVCGCSFWNLLERFERENTVHARKQ